MSTFPGIMREYSLISLDRFDGRNLQSSVYFLSHNHADHTVGLDQSAFQYRLGSNSHIKLYCSKITRDLLLLDDRYKSLKPSIVGLEVNEPCPISLIDPQTGKEKDNVTVTLLPAEHCPGSVMCLFEGSEGTVLYTGDFRLTKADLMNMSHLHMGNGPKEIKSMYTDTTFCVPQAIYIPDRDLSIQAAIDLVQEWISQSPHHVIQIRHKAALGYETLFKKLCIHFKMKVHVHPSKYQQYQKVGDMAEYTTPDPTDTQIHACKKIKQPGSSPLPCGYMPKNCKQLHLRSIAVSTMVFVQRVGLDTYAKRVNEKYFRVCYSFHSSYSEVRDMICYLKPDRAFPNVIPMDETMEKIQQRINNFVELAKRNVLTSSPNQYKALGKLKVRKRKLPRQKLSQLSNESADLHFGDIGESPIKSKRHKVNATIEEDTNPEHTTTTGQDTTTEQDTTTASKSSGTDLRQEFPLLCGDAKSEGASLELSQNTDRMPPESGDDEDSEMESDDEELDLRLSLSQEDREDLEHFTPKLQDLYGSLLGYASGDDDLEDTNMERITDSANDHCEKVTSGKMTDNNGKDSSLPNGCVDITTDISDEASDATSEGFILPNGRVDLCEEDLEEMPLDESEGVLLPNGRVDLSVKTTGAKEVLSVSVSEEISSGSLSSKGDLREQDKSGSSLLLVLDQGQGQGARKPGSTLAKDISADSGDVILLEDDEDAAKVTSTVMPEKAGLLSDQLGQDEARDCPAAVADQGKLQGSPAPAEAVIATIDLTDLDEDDDVYPSTSTHQPNLYNYHGENLFNRFSHPAMRPGALLGAAGPDDDDIEYSEREVECSDDECECGGKPNGGTHKYMVPRPKKVTAAPQYPETRAAESDGSEEGEVPAHVRTRKWIESQSLYMQRRNYLNSQPVSSSEVIVIDSDEEDDEGADGNSNGGGEKAATNNIQENSVQIQEGNSVEENDGTDGRVVDADKEDGSSVLNQQTETNSVQREESSVRNREKDSLSLDMSPTSCPTNLSILAQASDPSLKSAVVNGVEQTVKMVNGDPSDHVENNEHGSKSTAEVEDKESAS